MDAINHIARMLKIKSSNFGFAGTKDRRAATTQRVSVLRQTIENLNWLNSKAPNIKVGDFSYHKAPIPAWPARRQRILHRHQEHRAHSRCGLLPGTPAADH